MSDYSLFPGQVVLAKATNPNGSKLVATKIWSDASAAAPPTKIRLSGPSESLDVVVASGPFSCSSDLDYEPLKDLLAYVATQRPHVLVLCGPFVDERHPMIESGHLTESFDAIFGRVMTMICETVADINTQVEKSRLSWKTLASLFRLMGRSLFMPCLVINHCEIKNGCPNLAKCSCYSGSGGWAARHLCP